jgi:hypothetical protein
MSAYIHALKSFTKKDHQKYLQDFKVTKMNTHDQAVEALGSIKSISKSDAQQLLQRYGVRIVLLYPSL